MSDTVAGLIQAGLLLLALGLVYRPFGGYLTHVFNTLVARLRERESQAELERLSVTDALTGLYNRRYLMGTLASEAQRSRRLWRPFSVLLADVDHFKQYNDTQGHPAGDAALTKIADILRKQTRAVDCVARYGGEEFLIVLPRTTVEQGREVAERVRVAIELDHTTLEAHMIKGEAFLKKGDPHAAMEALQRARQLAPTDARVAKLFLDAEKATPTGP